MLTDELLRRALVNPREPRRAPAKVSPVLETVIRVLEQARDPMQVQEIHVAAEQLAGQPLRRESVKAALAGNIGGGEARFARVRRGYYQVKGTQHPDEHSSFATKGSRRQLVTKTRPGSRVPRSATAVS